MLKLFISLLLASTALAQVPAPPACLSGPVTQGSVTLTCAAIDNSGYAVLTDPAAAAYAGYALQLKALSTDPDVVAVRIGLTWQQGNADPKSPPYVYPVRWVLASKTEGGFLYTFNLIPSYDSTTLKTLPFAITSIQVQELRASATQTF